MSTPVALHPLTAGDLSAYTRARLRHLTTGAALYVPGSDSASHAHAFHPDTPPQLYRHPYTTTQMPLLAGTFNTLPTEITETWLISIAHLAHNDCPACEATWTDATECLDSLTPGATLFQTQPFAPHYLMIHREDHP